MFAITVHYYDTCSDGVLSVLVLGQYQIALYLELAVCWRQHHIGNAYYDMANFYVCVLASE